VSRETRTAEKETCATRCAWRRTVITATNALDFTAEDPPPTKPVAVDGNPAHHRDRFDPAACFLARSQNDTTAATAELIPSVDTDRREPRVPPGPHDTTALQLYTTEEAARILRVRSGWLERQAAARKIPFTMLGGSYRFTTDHLAEIVVIFEQSPSQRTSRQRKSIPPQRTSSSSSDTTQILRSRPRAPRNVA
jgi:excisionase family DNA binding protein